MNLDRIRRFIKTKAVKLRPSFWSRKKIYVPIEMVELLFALQDKGQLETYLDAIELVKQQNSWGLPRMDNTPPAPPRHKNVHQPTVDNTDKPPKKR